MSKVLIIGAGGVGTVVVINKKQVKKIVLNKDKIKHNYVKMSVEYGKLKPTIESRLTHKHFSFPL